MNNVLDLGSTSEFGATFLTLRLLSKVLVVTK